MNRWLETVGVIGEVLTGCDSFLVVAETIMPKKKIKPKKSKKRATAKARKPAKKKPARKKSLTEQIDEFDWRDVKKIRVGVSAVAKESNTTTSPNNPPK